MTSRELPRSGKDNPVQPNAIIFHGTGATPDVAWYPWLGRRLAERGFAVERPHSGGAALLLAILQHIDATVAQAVLVAGYSTQPNTEDEPVLQDSYDWDAIP